MMGRGGHHAPDRRVLAINTERVESSLGSVAVSTRGVAVTTGGASNTKGTPATIVASTAFRSRFAVLWAADYALNAGTSKGAMDLLLDGEILVADLLFGYCGAWTAFFPKIWMLPLEIPEGAALSVQAAGERTSTAFRVGIKLYEFPRGPGGAYFTRCDTLGSPSVPNGTGFTPGAASAEGAWAQIIASTARRYGALFPSVQVDGEASVAARNLTVDVGIGGAGAEQAFPETFEYQTDATEAMGGPLGCPGPIYQDIPDGVRLAVRGGESGAIDQMQAVLHAFY